jgi:hypothetical protein
MTHFDRPIPGTASGPSIIYGKRYSNLMALFLAATPLPVAITSMKSGGGP